jgi:hypothetical protein
MRRSLYGHDYKPPSHALRNWLIAIAGVIAVFTFVWKTYDPQTLRLMSGVRPEGGKLLPVSEPPRIDAKPRSGAQDKRAPR